MASADLSFTKDGLIYRPGHHHEEEEEPDDFLAETSHRDGDICRVCRTESSPARPLFHPCLCTGSIKYIHQECLVQWLKHSGKSHCELCKHKFIFNPVYHPSMPRQLSFTAFVRELMRNGLKNVRHWLHLSLVALIWLFFMPLCIYRIYRVLFYGTLWTLFRLPLELISMNNLLSDGLYGLMLVAIALLGFISVVWLQDQIRNGGGPQWLDEDRRQINQIQRREAENRLHHLQAHLDEAERRSRIRQNAPERLLAARQVCEAQVMRDGYMKQLERVQTRRFSRRLEKLRLRHMELAYDLGVHQQQYILMLGGARRKMAKIMEEWQAREIKERIVAFEAEHGTDAQIPPGWLHHTRQAMLPPDTSIWEHTLSREELTIMKLHGRAQWMFGEGEREEAEEDMRRVKKEMERVMEEHERHTQMICQVLTYGEHYVFNITSDEEKEEGGKEMEADWGEKEIEGPIGQLIPRESYFIRKLRKIKVTLAEAMRNERQIANRQNTEERERRQGEEERMNRWYNRLLGRHQEDPLAAARRRRQQQANQRPNIGRALVGLARDRPPEQGVGDQAEEITWARLLGLDGTYKFLEHVLWLICLVSALIVGFIYLPYQIGNITATIFSLWDRLGIVTWKGVIATFTGYLMVSALVTLFYYGMGWLKLPRMRNILGVTYIAIKVGIILTVEAGLFPLMCGWWIDICAFSLFGSTLQSRQESLQRAPGTVMFLHWLAGMIFIFYLASFVMLLREVLRPGVLWFLRNLNDHNFHPVQEMIGLPFPRHMRRFIMSCLMFGVCVMLALLLPSKIISILLPRLLPFNLTLASSISPIREIQLELVLLQFVIPTLLEHGNSRAGLKLFLKAWATSAATLFGLHSYLLDKPQTGGKIVDIHEHTIREVPEGPVGQGPVYQGPTQVLGPGFAPFKPYLRPHYFHLRLVGFLLFSALTAVATSILTLTVPVCAGRILMWVFGVSQAPDIYTAAIGLYSVWLVVRVGSTVLHYTSQGLRILATQINVWAVQGVKCVVVGVLLLVVVPLLLGHLVDLVLVTPLRVPSNRTPLFYPSTEWALGLLHTKCICGAIWLTNIQFKQTLDQVYQAGVRNLNLSFILQNVAWPIILGLSLAIALPYLLFMGLLPILGLPYEVCLLVYRYFFPVMLAVLVSAGLAGLVVGQVRHLYETVKNEKYLVSRQLVNYGEIPMVKEVKLRNPVQESGQQ